MRTGKLDVRIPRGFNVYTLRGLGPVAPGTRPPVAGHVLTDFRLPTLAHKHGTVGERLARYLKNGPMANQVGLELAIFPWPIPEGGISDKLHLPLTFTQPWYQPRPANGAVGTRAGFLSYGGTTYQVVYWSGPTAPANDRAAVLRALRSIRPTR